MPKITTGGGPSNRFAPQPPQERPGEGVFFAPVPGSPEALAEDAADIAASRAALADPAPSIPAEQVWAELGLDGEPEPITEPASALGSKSEPPTNVDAGGEQLSPGNSSSTSSPPSARTTRRRPSKAQPPAPSTEPPSSPPPTEAADSAPTGTTSGPGTDGEASLTPPAAD